MTLWNTPRKAAGCHVLVSGMVRMVTSCRLGPSSTWFYGVAVMLGPLVSPPAIAHGGWGDGWGHAMYGSVLMVLGWTIVIVACVLAIRHLTRRNRRDSASGHSGGLRILEERFARGELDQEEFEARRRALRG